MREYIKIGLRDQEYAALAEMAEQELRPIPMQAQHLILRALRERQLLPCTQELGEYHAEAKREYINS